MRDKVFKFGDIVLWPHDVTEEPIGGLVLSTPYEESKGLRVIDCNGLDFYPAKDCLTRTGINCAEELNQILSKVYEAERKARKGE